jgi:hypothetical protein
MKKQLIIIINVQQKKNIPRANCIQINAWMRVQAICSLEKYKKTDHEVLANNL